MMSGWRRFFRRRPVALALAGGLLALMAGDRAQLAPPPGVGIDPFEVLDQQVRNNVLIVLDTSGSMKWPVDRDNFTLGGDDPSSRMYQAKQAIKAVVAANQNRVNFGLVSYNVLALDKNLNEGQNFENDGRVDGPFIYVSADGTAAPFYTTHSNAEDTTTGEAEVCTGVDGFFCRISNTLANYDGANSADVWRSFMNRNGTAQTLAYNDPYPAGCTNDVGALSPINLSAPASMRCRYYMQSRVIRNGRRYTWSRASTNIATRLLATSTITCPAPPAGLIHAPASPAPPITPPCFQLQDGTNGPVSTFYYSSAIYERQNGDSCGGGALITSVAPCTGNNAPLVLTKMEQELPLTPAGAFPGIPWPPPEPIAGAATGGPFDYGDGHNDGDQTPEFGLRADQSTPLAGTLCGVAGNPGITACNGAVTMGAAFPAPIPGVAQKNFVILVTDGDDTCADNNTDIAAVRAGEAAERLYRQFNPVTQTGNFQRWAETLVVGFASAVNPARVNVIAQGGSGRQLVAGATTPAAAMAGTCNPWPGGECRDAFFASSTQQLIDVLNAALEAASSSGFFSSTASVFDGVPEYVRTVPVPPSPSPAPSPFEPMDPESRYRANAFRTYRSSFEASTFNGFVIGFDDCGAMVTGARPAGCPTYPASGITGVSGNWEAGQRLIDPDRISSDLHPTTGVDHTFAGLLQTATTPIPVGAPGQGVSGGVTHIHRRIFTTRQNGRRLGSADDPLGATMGCAGGSCRVNLWPPDLGGSNVGVVMSNAADYSGVGILDDRLFRKADGTQMTITDLQAAPLKACLGNSLPPACNPAAPATQLAAARKEAREMIIAFTAGAAARRDNLGQPVRDATGQIVYRRRNWVLSDSTLATPALMTPPLQLTPAVHTQEYLLYRDGPRDEPSGQASGGNTDAFLRQGYGLRNPDRDGKELPSPGTLNRTNLKPVMSVVFVPSNDMLHAFRAGPCPRAPLTGRPPVGSCAGESGGEELWAFVPHDLLPKLKDRMKTQTRQDHTFMLAASLRFADVFLPGAVNVTVTGKTYNLTGRWRRLLMFGRGMGGKYYSALDVTGIGSFTSPALSTNLPAVLWNRGNPDTIDGLGSGTRVGTNQELNQYADMGLTWSTPAVARVNANANNNNKEFVAYVGSGYSTGTNDNEGTRFYTLDPFNGDIIASDDVGEGAQPAFQNALVANPVIYAGERLVAGVDLPHPSSPINQFVYIGDIHGRVWRFDSDDPRTRQLFRNLGPDHPVGVGAALLNLGTPRVFVTSGADARVPTPSNGFRMFGFEDQGPPYPVGVVGPPLTAPEFLEPFPASPAGKGDYRGTLQPLTAFRGASAAGPAEGVVFFTGTRFNPPGARCISGFDTVIFGLTANGGGTAYASTEFFDVKSVGMNRPPVPPGGTSIIDQMDHHTGAGGTQPEPTKTKTSTPSTPATARLEVVRPGSSVCR